jgi:hypothetical protein
MKGKQIPLITDLNLPAGKADRNVDSLIIEFRFYFHRSVIDPHWRDCNTTMRKNIITTFSMKTLFDNRKKRIEGMIVAGNDFFAE